MSQLKLDYDIVLCLRGMAQVLRETREEAGLTLREAATRIGSDHVTIGNLERASSLLRVSQLLALARAYGVPATILLDLAWFRGEAMLRDEEDAGEVAAAAATPKRSRSHK